VERHTATANGDIATAQQHGAEAVQEGIEQGQGVQRQLKGRGEHEASTFLEYTPHISWQTAHGVLIGAVIEMADLTLAIHQDEACTMGDGPLGLVVWMRATVCQR
jgi:hypothetical protein